MTMFSKREYLYAKKVVLKGLFMLNNDNANDSTLYFVKSPLLSRAQLSCWTSHNMTQIEQEQYNQMN